MIEVAGLAKLLGGILWGFRCGAITESAPSACLKLDGREAYLGGERGGGPKRRLYLLLRVFYLVFHYILFLNHVFLLL